MHINDLLKIAVERQGVRPPHQGREPPGHPRRWRSAAAGRAQAPHAGRHDRDGVLDHVVRQKEKFKNNYEIDIAYSVPGLGPLPRATSSSSAARRHGAARHPGRDPELRRAEPAAGRSSKICEERARADPRHRHHRLGQVDDARGDDRLHQPHRTEHIITIEDPIEFLHRDKTSRSSTSARSASTPTSFARRCARRCARIPTSSSSAKCATTRPSRRRCTPPRPATS